LDTYFGDESVTTSNGNGLSDRMIILLVVSGLLLLLVSIVAVSGVAIGWRRNECWGVANKKDEAVLLGNKKAIAGDSSSSVAVNRV